MKQAPEGWALGPLQVDAPAGHRVVLDQFEYQQPESSSLLDSLLSKIPLVGLALPMLAEKHNPPEEQETVSRRDLIKAGVVALGGAAVAESARADSGTLDVAEISIHENKHSMGLQLWDGVEVVLPSDMEYSVVVDDDPIDVFGVDSTAVVPPGVTGQVVVRTEESLSTLQSLQWSAFGHEPVSYEFELDRCCRELRRRHCQ